MTMPACKGTDAPVAIDQERWIFDAPFLSCDLAERHHNCAASKHVKSSIRLSELRIATQHGTIDLCPYHDVGPCH